jgi:hypothetical protein
VECRGHVFKMRPKTTSDPAALWLEVRRKASCMMTGVIQLYIIGIEPDGVGGPSQGKVVHEGSARCRDRAAVSICGILATTSSGAAMRRLVVSSRIMERSVGRV